MINPPVFTKPQRSAFTLIELLVVIAIIAILAAILFPVFARARENARRSSCQSNVKQILLGVIQYTQDFDEKYPPAYNTQANPNLHWFDVVQPYLKSKQIFTCPSDTSTSSANPNASDVDYHVSYLASIFTGTINSDGSGSSRSLAAFEFPSTTVYMADGMKVPSADGSVTPASPNKMDPSCKLCLLTTSDFSAINDVNDSNWGAPNPRHLDTAVFGFIDGHVKSGLVSSYYGAAGTAKGDCLNRAKGCQ